MNTIFSLKEPSHFFKEEDTLAKYLSERKGLSVLLFLLGLLGPTILSLFTTLALKAYGLTKENDELLISLLGNFIPYIICFLAFLGIIIFVPGFMKAMIKTRVKTIGICIALTAIAYGVYVTGSNLLARLTEALVGVTENANQSILIDMFNYSPLLLLIMTVIFAPLVEEMTYRAGLFGIFGHKHKIVAIIVSGFLFAFIHFDFTSIMKSVDSFLIELANIPPYILAGLVFGYLYALTDNVLPSMAIHLVNNLLSALVIISGFNLGE